MIKLANYIRFLRLQKGLSQENIADELGISVTAYSKIERGVTNISFSRLKQIAECLGVSMTSLMDYYENGDNNQPIHFEKKKHSYLHAMEYNESTVEYMRIRIKELEESVRILRKAIIDMREFMKKEE